MLGLSEIWDCLQDSLPRDRWFSLEDVYDHIQSHLHLDKDDFEPEVSGSTVPKWKRNVRNVLQYRKRKGEIQWDGNANYKL